MEEPGTMRYWCHVCAQEVSPVMEVELKCPRCNDGFVEEMGGLASGGESDVFDPDLGSDRTLSLWAPVLLGMMGNPRRRRRARRLEFEDEDRNDENDGSRADGETELVREIETIIQRRRRSSASILQLLQGIRSGIGSDLENLETGRDGLRDGGSDAGERVILVNPFSQTIVLHDSSNDAMRNPATLTSLGDYFVGPGLDLLLQHLAENNPNRHGTPPAQKEAVEAMPTVKIAGNINVQCSICLDELNAGEEAREMPCPESSGGGEIE
ncbi:hypothetical protein MLD38_011818 [Melastoma candidum]|uniref:Uncharacterized protein n=1 Tax=Melastoma candidum TaxID=119954 RepID=A0ACB9RCM9_9MYRT|nr:hypothetical protein MLD38_011818 [Melastoma candidum]